MDPQTAVIALAAVLTVQATWMLTRRPNLDQLLRVLFWVTVTALAYFRIPWLAFVAAGFLILRMARLTLRSLAQRSNQED